MNSPTTDTIADNIATRPIQFDYMLEYINLNGLYLYGNQNTFISGSGLARPFPIWIACTRST